MQNISERFLIVSIIPQNASEKESFVNIQELISLVETYGGKVADIVLQNREIHDKGAYIGRGKTEEVSQIIVEKNIDVVVLNRIIKPGQIYDLQAFFEKSKLGIQVWDRVDLILKIFSKHADTAEAKLQIELAAMRHMGPRIYGMGEEMSRQGGMVGTRGIGETNTERMKRHWREQIKKTRDDLKKLSQNRRLQMEQRRKNGMPTVSLIGYTNAGKTSLFNKLTNKNKLVKNELFVTLESVSGKVYLKSLSMEILVTDTIGFIRDLPPQLIDAFRSTLMESIYADVLVHVIDVSDPDMEKKIETVERIIHELSLQDKKIIYVFNKTDQAIDLKREQIIQRYNAFNPQFISVKTGEGIAELLDTVANLIS